MLANEQLSDGAYDWLKVLKYYMEIRNVLQATNGDHSMETTRGNTTAENDKQSKSSSQHCGKYHIDYLNYDPNSSFPPSGSGC